MLRQGMLNLSRPVTGFAVGHLVVIIMIVLLLSVTLMATFNSSAQTDMASVAMSNKERQTPGIERNRARVAAARASGYEDSFRSSKFFWDNWIPEWSCETLERIGNAGDGGKFVCDMNRLIQHAVSNSSKCVMYSLGSNNEIDFELQFHGLAPACEIHVFDPTVKSPKAELTAISTYHHWAISIDSSSKSLAASDGSNDGSNSGKSSTEVKAVAAASSSGLRDARTGQLAEEHTVTEIMHLLGHDQVQFMKMDVEGSEWAMLQSMLANADTELYLPDGRPRILTWMIEFHADPNGKSSYKKEIFPDTMIAAVEGLLQHYYIYATEPNPHSGYCHELAFIHKMAV